MNKSSMKFAAVCLVIALIGAVFTTAAAALSSDGITLIGNLSDDAGGGSVYQADAAAQNPDNYINISGFSVEVKLNKMGAFSGALPMSVLLATKGAHTPDEYVFTYPDNFPVYDLASQEVVAITVGANSYIGPMAFSTGKSMDEDFLEGETRTLTYEGNAAIFTEENSVLTMVSYTGDFEILGIEWIFGEITQTAGEPWDKVEKSEFPDIPTVEDSVQNGNNYIDITIPATGKDAYPVIFWIHGGGWSSMSRKSCILDDTKEYLLAQGYAFVSAEYTLCVRNEDGTIDSPGMQMVNDLKAAVRFIRANAETYHLDTNYIVAMGESAGAHLALILGTTNGNPEYEDLSMGNADMSSDVSAAVSYFGPTSMVCEDENANQGDLLLAYGLLGEQVMTYSDEMITLEKQMSPAFLVSENTVPLYLTHSREDGTVPFDQSERMYEAAKAFLSDNDLQTVFYDTGSHGDRSTFDTYSAYTSVTEFINSHNNTGMSMTAPAEESSTSSEEPATKGISTPVIILIIVAVVALAAVCVAVMVKKKTKRS